MRFDKFTVKAQEAVVRAQELAQQRDHAEILPLHLLASLLGEEEGVVLPLVQKIGADVGRLTADAVGDERILRILGDGPRHPARNGLEKGAAAVKPNPPGEIRREIRRRRRLRNGRWDRRCAHEPDEDAA